MNHKCIFNLWLQTTTGASAARKFRSNGQFISPVTTITGHWLVYNATSESSFNVLRLNPDVRKCKEASNLVLHVIFYLAFVLDLFRVTIEL